MKLISRNLLLSLSLLLCFYTSRGQEWEPVLPKIPYLKFSQGWKIPSSDKWIVKSGYYKNSIVAIGSAGSNDWDILNLPYSQNTNGYGLKDISFLSKKSIRIIYWLPKMEVKAGKKKGLYLQAMPEKFTLLLLNTDLFMDIMFLRKQRMPGNPGQI